MSVINVLDIKTANLIAAGEVVERPSSVVKELVENSIDAGATKITVEIRGGGVSMIRVTDNGCGMSAEDLPLCILRHATSKISTGDDLNAISTLGFRGEALAATAAVSKMKIVSKRKNDKLAHTLNVNYGVCSRVTECGGTDGTVITVSELFSNVPARRKFLKADKTEAASVGSVCEKLALSCTDVSLTFISDGVRKFSTAGDGILKNAVYAVLGRQIANELIPVDGESEGIHVSGGIATPLMARGNRAFELFFINGRYIKSGVISDALEQAVVSFYPAERFPCAVLFVDMHPSVVDVNVHPSKLEVKFSSDRPVFDAVYYAVKKATEAGQRPVIEPTAFEPARAPLSPFVPVTDEYTKTEIKQLTAFDKPEIPAFKMPAQETADTELTYELRSPSFTHITEEPAPRISASYGQQRQITQAAPAYHPESEEERDTWRIIGEAFDTYLFVEDKEDILVIDKHAAHERLRFETLKNAMKRQTKTAQVRMVPLYVTLDAQEREAAEKYVDSLHRAGFEFTVSENGCELTQTPSYLKDAEASDLFVCMLAELIKHETDPSLTEETVLERALYQISCKGAIKGGDKNDPIALKALVRELYANPDVTFCPHGRPVAFKMNKAAIERRFKRT